MKLTLVEPDGWKAPKGYANGVLVAGASKLLHVAGQIAWDANQQLVGRGDFAAQFEQALANVCAVVRAAGGEPAHLVKMTVYVVDKRAYLAAVKPCGDAWKRHVGRHWPAMALVQVADLLEDGALVEMEAVAALA